MTIIEKRINDSQIDEITGLVHEEKGMITFDKNDVKNVLVGKEGMLYQAYQEDGVDNRTFMKDFFDELKKKESVQNSTSLLISIDMSPEDPLMMEDMEIIQDFFDSFDYNDFESRWCVKNNNEGCRMVILAVCAKDR